MKRTVVVGLFVLAARAVAAQEKQPVFPAEVEVVTVDVVVADRNGEPVTDLKAADFTVKDDGVAQPVTTFELVHRPAPATPEQTDAAATPSAPAPPPRVTSNQSAAARSARTFVIVFDDLHLDIAQAKRARDAAAEFLRTGLAEGDGVTLVATGSDVHWSGRLPGGRTALLQVLERLPGRRTIDSARDYMSDYEAMRIWREGDTAVIERVARRFLQTQAIVPEDAGSTDVAQQRGDPSSWVAYVRGRAGQVYERSAVQNRAALGVIARALDALQGVRGRKSLVLLSGGFVSDPHLSGFREVVGAARRANTAIYFIDARGLEATSTALSAEVGVPIQSEVFGTQLAEAGESREGSEQVAADTGGFTVKNANDLSGALRRISRESQSYYLIGYSPSNPRRDGRFRKIEVQVARAGLTVRARRGYYAPGGSRSEAAPVEAKDAAIQRALDSPFDLADVPLRAVTHVFGEAEPGKVRTLVTVEADVHGFAFRDEGGFAADTLDFLLVVAHRETGEHFRYDNQFQMKLKPETRRRVARTGFPITREFALLPGGYQARVVVRDRNSGRTGALTHDFEVPPGDGLRLSSLVVTDRVGEGPQAAVPQPAGHRTFAATGTLHCGFEVYGAAADVRTGAPRVSAGFAVRYQDGRLLAAAQATPVQPGPGGVLARTVGVPLDGAPLGRYELIVVVRDDASGRTLEARELFAIEAVAAP